MIPAGALCPVDIVLSEHPATVLQPDLLITCQEHIRRSRERWKNLQKLQGAPKFAAEVLSPSTKRRDLGIKYMKYLESGVKEYWIVDPAQQKVLVYDLAAIRDEGTHKDVCCLYGPDRKVPLLLSEGNCEIDFPGIWRKAEDLMRS